MESVTLLKWGFHFKMYDSMDMIYSYLLSPKLLYSYI
jgi:hypothetical protein